MDVILCKDESISPPIKISDWSFVYEIITRFWTITDSNGDVF